MKILLGTVGGILLFVLLWYVVTQPYRNAYPAGASPLASASLAATGGSGVTGTVSFVPTSDGQSTNVTTRLSGLAPNQVYAVTIQNGACLGPRLFALAGVVGDASGQGSNTTTVPAQPASYWFMVAHESASPDAPMVACGQVRVTGTTPGYVPPGGANQSGGGIPVQNQQPYQLPNGGGGPPKTPIPTPGR
jgi:hypothetical protein